MAIHTKHIDRTCEQQSVHRCSVISPHGDDIDLSVHQIGCGCFLLFSLVTMAKPLNTNTRGTSSEAFEHIAPHNPPSSSPFPGDENQRISSNNSRKRGCYLTLERWQPPQICFLGILSSFSYSRGIKINAYAPETIPAKRVLSNVRGI